jgi:hypothetical protein
MLGVFAKTSHVVTRGLAGPGQMGFMHLKRLGWDESFHFRFFAKYSFGLREKY